MNAKVGFVLIFLLSVAPAVSSQTKVKPGASQNAVAKTEVVRTTAAYAEILLRRTERESELEEFLLDYKEEFPKVKEIRFELGLLQKELERLLAVNAAEVGKLTLALGKLIVRKVEIEVDLWNLRQQYQDDNPEVKRAKRRIEIYERAIKEIL